MPSRREQAAQWWATQITRFVIGGGGLIWEAVIDKLHNPTALVVFGGLCGAPDVVGYVGYMRRLREHETAGQERWPAEHDEPEDDS